MKVSPRIAAALDIGGHMQLGENIYKYRTERGLSQGALADALEVSRQSVSKWENNSSVPELDKLLKMSKLFNVTLDELVMGPTPLPTVPTEKKKESGYVLPNVTPRTIVGSLMLLFGMIFFLLSIFWGDQLYFGEEFGELVSISIVLVSLALIATYNQLILATCAVIYFIYCVVCTGILHITGLTNYIFMFLTGGVILVWFIVLGLHENKSKTYEEDSENQ